MTSTEEELSLENVVDNPDILAAAQAFTRDDEEPDLPDPTDGPVTLPAGFHRVKTTRDGTQIEEVRTAWIRELNGEDEERIARAKLKDDGAAFVSAILVAGVERLGDEVPTKDDFNSLVMGDRDFLLLEIARATYGDKFEYEEYTCPVCGEKFAVSLSLGEDIPVRRLDSIEETSFEVRLKNDRVASVNLPTVSASASLVKAKSPAEANTLLIANGVQEIRGPKGTTTIVGDLDAARRLKALDREALVREMSDRMPGPQYNEVKFTHEPGCGEEIRLVIRLTDMFRSL